MRAGDSENSSEGSPSSTRKYSRSPRPRSVSVTRPGRFPNALGGLGLPRKGSERRPEHLERALHVLVAVREGHVELLLPLHDALLQAFRIERPQEGAVGGQHGAVVGERTVREHEIEYRRLADHLSRKARLLDELG